MREDSLENNFKKGLTTLAVLTLLQRGPMYGYQLVQTMGEVSQGEFALQEGTTYPVFYRLQEKGYITGERVLVGKRMTRVYYTLTPEGEAYLTKIRAIYDSLTAGLQRLLDYGNET